MSTEKPSKPEEEFIHREEAQDASLQRALKEKEAEEQARTEAQKLHYMKCPKCGGDLKSEISHAIEIDRCTGCAGVWLDDGELEKLAGEDSQLLSEIIKLFRDVGKTTPISDM